MLRIAVALSVVLLAGVLPPTAAAEAQSDAQPQPPDDDRSILNRLMQEPVTLFDWGMARLDRDIASAARRTFRGGYGLGEPKARSTYDWRSKQVILSVTVPMPAAERTQTACKHAFQDIVATLTEAAPASPDAAGWYLLTAFQPDGHFWTSRFEDVGGKLLDVVRLRIGLIPPTADAVSGDSARVRCSGPLDARADEIEVEVTS